MRYGIKSGHIGTSSTWIVTLDGREICHLGGGTSGIVALAAAESLNKGFVFDGWSKRLLDLISVSEEPENIHE